MSNGQRYALHRCVVNARPFSLDALVWSETSHILSDRYITMSTVLFSIVERVQFILSPSLTLSPIDTERQMLHCTAWHDIALYPHTRHSKTVLSCGVCAHGQCSTDCIDFRSLSRTYLIRAPYLHDIILKHFFMNINGKFFFFPKNKSTGTDLIW